MADGHVDAGTAQTFDVCGIGQVAALHGIAEIMQHLGDPGHADAADADEMNCADGEWKSPHGNRSGVSACSTRSASTAAASERPSPRAASAAAARAASAPNKLARRAARAGAVNSV